MTRTRTLRIVCTALLALLVAAGTALAAGPAKPRLGAHYVFRGHLRAASATSVSLTVEGGNRIALKKMLGSSVDQTFAVGSGTEFLRWSGGIPTVVGYADLKPGDWVVVRVRAPRDADLAAIEAQPAAVVADRAVEPAPPGKPLYLFRGTIAGTSGSSLTVHVAGGNRRALRLLIGQQADQAFAVDGETIFLLWQGRVPTVISLAQLKTGDRVVVRIRADRGASLADVEATPAAHVGEREPAATAAR